MNIDQLILTDFRSYPAKKIRFSSSITVILGDNAAGKTNLLEAIFFLATGKSFRADKDTEMIAFGREMARIKGKINQLTNNPITQLTNEEIELEIMLTKGEVIGIKTPIKKYLVNGVGKKMLDFVGIVKTVLFWPEDLELVTDSPGRRRRYLDFVLLQTDREYRRSLLSYEKGVRQRNKVLEAIRDRNAHRHQLLFWDQLLVKTGDYITRKREEYIHFVNNFQFGGPVGVSNFQFPKYEIFYDRSVISEARLAEYSEEETAAAVTLVGPHRDDMEFRIQNSEFRIKAKDTSDGGRLSLRSHDSSEVEESRSLSHFGSRGEQRLAILWLKMGELAFIEEITGEKPILLLDDIFSELDHEHRKIIFDVVSHQQTIMTTTDLHHIDHDKLKDIELIKL